MKTDSHLFFKALSDQAGVRNFSFATKFSIVVSLLNFGQFNGRKTLSNY